MLNRRQKQQEQPAVQTAQSSADPFTYINQGTEIQGNIVAKGRVRIHGLVRGNIMVDGVLEIAEDGVVEGEMIAADEVKIIGHVKANVEAKVKVEIWQKGILEGDIRAATLDIEEGATFIGRSDMRPSGHTPKLTEVSESMSVS
ncbi:MAG: bactofilin family protein [Trueperaceae bacterium]